MINDLCLSDLFHSSFIFSFHEAGYMKIFSKRKIFILSKRKMDHIMRISSGSSLENCYVG